LLLVSENGQLWVSASRHRCSAQAAGRPLSIRSRETTAGSLLASTASTMPGASAVIRSIRVRCDRSTSSALASAGMDGERPNSMRS